MTTSSGQEHFRNLRDLSETYVKAKWTELLINLPNTILRVPTFFYYNALKRNTLDAIQAINDELDPDRKDALIYRFLRFKINESKYVQVAGAVLFASVISCLSWDEIASSHWSARALFYSSIVLALVAVVAGAQQLMIFPDEEIRKSDLKLLSNCLTRDAPSNGAQHRHVNNVMVFALQMPLMLFSYSVASFLAGLFAVVFGTLRPVWGDDARIAVVFGAVNAAVIILFYTCSTVIYKVPHLTPQSGTS